MLGDGSLFNRLFIEHYYEYQAPHGLQRARDLAEARGARERADPVSRSRRTAICCCSAGFREVEVFFKWYNFAGFVAVK